MQGLLFRLALTAINIFFPPLSVAILCGLELDCMINCCLFLLAVIPSHIHGFYISRTYFHRRRKVKKGRYPGGPKSFIHSRNVINGGATDAEVAGLYRKECGVERKCSNGRHGSTRRNGSKHRPQNIRCHESYNQLTIVPGQDSRRRRYSPIAIQAQA
ncbi:hypothetical protein M433DRAFT_260703 [Acidomyces richmondensis BFW]|nr:MAG: hypothetical protein FE78DRAFT_433312 [Acidomyces sp. 'richmondensis']KYG49722.1 hypothetical protein M433DRAFT_260703 [Acidomyces richmondensis BFW]